MGEFPQDDLSQAPTEQPSMTVRFPTVEDRQCRLAANFIEGIRPYIEGPGENGLGLRPHQSPALEELRDFFVETADTPDRRILWPAPPNFGKSTMAPLVIRAAGIGREQTDGTPPLKGLVLVPKDVARRQIIQACESIVPEARIKSYYPKHSEHLIDEADLLVMTYKGCIDTWGSKWDYIASRIDLVVLDEVHRSLGPHISKRLNQTMEQYKPTTLALSATPDFNQNHSTENVLNIDRTITPMTPREAAQTGVSNGVQLIALHSGQTMEMVSRYRNVSDSDVCSFIDNEPRNKLIVDVMRDMAALGRQGLVHCLPGGSNQHADIIAEQANQRRFVDPRTGEERNMRVESVGMYKPDNPRRIQDLKDGKLDALTFSKYLIEAFDYEGVRYVFSVSPTSSAVDMGQLVGRGARLGDPRITKLLCLIDHYRSSRAKNIQTPFHVFGAEGFTQGEVIYYPDYQKRFSDPDKHKKDAPPHDPQGTRAPYSISQRESMYEGLSGAVLAAIEAMPPGTILDQMLVTRDVLTKVPEGYMPLADVPFVKAGKVSITGAVRALRDHLGQDGQPLSVTVQQDKLRTFVSPDAAVFLQERLDYGDQLSRIEITNFLVSQGWPHLSFSGFAAEAAAIGVEFSIIKKAVYMDTGSARQLLLHLAETPFADPREEVLVQDLARALGDVRKGALYDALKLNEDMYRNHIRMRRRGWQPGAYRSVQALSTAGAVMLGCMLVDTNPRLGHLDAEDIEATVADVQRNYRQFLWRNKMHTRLGMAAIEAFIGRGADVQPSEEIIQYKDDTPAPAPAPARRPAPTRQPGKPRAAKSKPAEPEAFPPPDGIDESYRLSPYGSEWVKYADCAETDPDLFFEATGKVAKILFAMCGRCAVKGDCLLFSLEVPVSGIRAGFHEEPRKRLRRNPKVIEWLKSTKPKGRKQTPPGQYGQTRRA